MSFCMDHVVAKKNIAKYDPNPASLERAMVFQAQCRMCGYEPEDYLHPPKICPKCYSQAWERFARPGSLLQNASRFGE